MMFAGVSGGGGGGEGIFDFGGAVWLIPIWCGVTRHKSLAIACYYTTTGF
jgi:hypothetical protein